MSENLEEQLSVAQTFLVLLNKLTPELYAIKELNDSHAGDIKFGEVRIIEYIQHGRVTRVELESVRDSRLVEDKI